MTETVDAIVTVTERPDVPANAASDFASTGALRGLRLADGRLIRPWIVWEVEESGGEYQELSHDDLLALGSQPSIETIVEIDSEPEEQCTPK